MLPVLTPTGIFEGWSPVNPNVQPHERPRAEALLTLPLPVFLLDRPWNRGPVLPRL